jgi:hypothetical protein
MPSGDIRESHLRTPLSTVSMPASARITSNRPGSFPSRSLIRYRARQPTSSRPITSFLAACATQGAFRRTVAPRILTRLLACSITASMCSRSPDRVTASKKSQAQQDLGLGAQEAGPCSGAAFGGRVDPGLVQDLPHGGSGDLHPEHQQLAMHPAVPPPGILPNQPQYQDADGAHGPRPARARGPGPPGVPTREHVAVPAQHGIRTHHQVQSLEHVPREPVQQRRQQRPVSRSEPHPARAELPLQDQELVSQREDLRVFLLAAHRQQSQHREHVRHTETGQSQQHGPSPCHSVPRHVSVPRLLSRTTSGCARTTAPTSMDEVFGRSTATRPGCRAAAYGETGTGCQRCVCSVWPAVCWISRVRRNPAYAVSSDRQAV